MTTPPPGKQPAAETLEEIAERCVREWVEHDLDEHFESGYDFMITMKPEDLIERILSALRNERERAAKICEQGAMLASPEGVIPPDDPEHERLQRLVTILISAARAIREGK